jgi:dihydroorotase
LLRRSTADTARIQGTTTAVSGGDACANNFAGYRRFIVASTRTRLHAFLHIANMDLVGFPVR